MVFADWHLGQVFFSLLWFALFFIWIWLLITVFIDIFRSHDMGGFAKALWVIFVIILPFLGVLVYLIARGHKMQEHAIEQAQRQEAMFKQYVQQTTSSGSTAEEIARLADLKANGTLSDAEFEQAKAKALGS
jgi:hypothetical protein